MIYRHVKTIIFDRVRPVSYICNRHNVERIAATTERKSLDSTIVTGIFLTIKFVIHSTCIYMLWYVYTRETRGTCSLNCPQVFGTYDFSINKKKQIILKQKIIILLIFSFLLINFILTNQSNGL